MPAIPFIWENNHLLQSLSSVNSNLCYDVPPIIHICNHIVYIPSNRNIIRPRENKFHQDTAGEKRREEKRREEKRREEKRNDDLL